MTSTQAERRPCQLRRLPLPEDSGLEAYLAENLYVPVEEARLQDAIDISRVPELTSRTMQAERFMVLGAALRTESGA